MQKKWTDSKTKIAVVLGAGGTILISLAGFFNGTVDVSTLVETVWKALTAGYLVVGVRGWFKK